MEEQILRLLRKRDYVPANVPQLLAQLRLPPPQQQELQRALRALEQQGQILRTKGGRYIQAREADLVPGTIRINRQGKGFLQPADRAVQEITIPESATGTALDGDKVLVRRDVTPQKPLRREGEVTGKVVRVLEHKRRQIVGTLQQGRRFLYVIPDDPRLPHDIYVPPPRDVGVPAKPGDKVVVALAPWPSRHVNPEGEIIEVLGAPDAEGVDLLSIIREHELPLHFPKDVLHQANLIAKPRAGAQPTPEELRGRVDCRAHRVITIDPDDAKDFDDAICLEPAGQDQWRLWVHIADVSHYVEPGTPLDREAQKRGNSTYLVDRVIPMLPEVLSNGLCSLHPGVDRLTKCVEFLLSAKGVVVQAKFYPAVIRSQRRYTYREAMAILERKPADPIERMLHQAHQLTQRLRRERFHAGALDLDFPETKIRLDAHGKILRIEKVESDPSHQLIEEFMLLANEAVGAHLKKLRRPTLYRVHQPPAEHRLREYREDVVAHAIPCGNLTHRPEVQKLLGRLNQSSIGPALKVGFLRSLMRAQYAVEPLGHYGLNKQNYTHFTSPIRRYADLVVHRSVFNPGRADLRSLQPVASHISETERNSTEAERESKLVKLFAFLARQIRTGARQSYNALVIEARNFGFFVDVPDLGLSGLVPLSSLADDFYVFDSVRGQLRGRRSRRLIKLGDKVLVQVEKVDSFKKQVDFRLAPAGKPASPPRDLKARFLEEPGARAIRE